MKLTGKHKEIYIGKMKGEQNTALEKEARGANKRWVGRHSESSREELKKNVFLSSHQIINGKINNLNSTASEVEMTMYNNKYKLEIQLGIL